jgi:hypothetical protein
VAVLLAWGGLCAMAGAVFAIQWKRRQRRKYDREQMRRHLADR